LGHIAASFFIGVQPFAIRNAGRLRTRSPVRYLPTCPAPIMDPAVHITRLAVHGGGEDRPVRALPRQCRVPTSYRTTPSLTHRRVTGSVGMDIRSRTSFSIIEHSRNHKGFRNYQRMGPIKRSLCLWHEGLYGRSAPLESVVLQLSTNLGSRNTISVAHRVPRHIRSPEARSSAVEPSRSGWSAMFRCSAS